MSKKSTVKSEKNLDIKRKSSFRLGFKPLVTKIVFPILIVLSLISSFGVSVYADMFATSNENVTALERNDLTNTFPQDDNGAINVLLLAYDTRTGANGKTHAGTSGGGANADTNMLLHISANRNFIQAVSLPRDTLVPIPSCKWNDGSNSGNTSAMSQAMLNVAFATGYYPSSVANPNKKQIKNAVKYGASCAVNTVEQITGVHIDHYAVVDFAGFIKTIDALKGIEICVPQSFGPLSHAGGLTLKQGYQTLNSMQAFQYARARDGIGDSSDYGRMRRQQAVLGAMVNKLYKKLDFYNLPLLYDFAKQALSSVTTDTDFNTAVGILYSLRNLNIANVTLFTAPTGGAPGNPNRLVLREPAASEVFRYFADDKSVLSLQDSSASLSNAVKSPTPSEIAILDGTITVNKITPPPALKTTSKKKAKDNTGGNIYRPSDALGTKKCGGDW